MSPNEWIMFTTCFPEFAKEKRHTQLDNDSCHSAHNSSYTSSSSVSHLFFSTSLGFGFFIAGYSECRSVKSAAHKSWELANLNPPPAAASLPFVVRPLPLSVHNNSCDSVSDSQLVIELWNICAKYVGYWFIVAANFIRALCNLLLIAVAVSI